MLKKAFKFLGKAFAENIAISAAMPIGEAIGRIIADKINPTKEEELEEEEEIIDEDQNSSSEDSSESIISDQS